MFNTIKLLAEAEPDSKLLSWVSGDKPQPLYRNFDPQCLRTHQADVHLVTLDNGVPQARCSLWWSHIPKISEFGKDIVIGHYASTNDVAAAELFDQVKKIAQKHNATCVVGPMDGNTWRSYRFVTESPKIDALNKLSHPDYFLEPGNPYHYPQNFIDAGFSPLANYSSALNSDLAAVDERIKKALQRFDNQGICLRTLDADKFEQELKQIFALSLESFVHNYLYTAITEAQFLSQYKKVQSLVQSELVLLAHDSKGTLLGYLFALPDIAQKMRGEEIDTIIIKTVAVKPGRESKGLGSVLVSEVQRRAHEAGYKKAIHALMHDSNTSNNISRHYAETIRRYTLFECKL